MSDQAVEGDGYEEIPLSAEARFGFTLGAQFTYRGNTYWPKVYCEDSPLAFQDEEGTVTIEDGESLRYRVTETVHQQMSIAVARTKREVDQRYLADQAARTQS